MDFIEGAYFAVCAAIAILGAIGTIAFPNPIRGALSLLFTIVAIAGMFLQLHAPFLASIQLIVYAGAVVVLFIFVIMLIGPDATAPKDGRVFFTRLVGAIAGGLITAEIGYVLSRKVPFARPTPVPAGFGSIDAFGALLFRDYLVPFEVASFLLMIAIVGAVAVARGKQPDPRVVKASTVANELPERGASPQLSVGLVGTTVGEGRVEEAKVRA